MEDAAGPVLIEAAREAASRAYAPYSRFAVGAALLFEDGHVATGANFENASYGLSLCAETVALAAASAAGRPIGDVVAVGVIGGAMDGHGGLIDRGVVLPCGRCRQVLNEAASLGGRDIAIFCADADGATIQRHSLNTLLPHAFGPDSL